MPGSSIDKTNARKIIFRDTLAFISESNVLSEAVSRSISNAVMYPAGETFDLSDCKKKTGEVEVRGEDPIILARRLKAGKPECRVAVLSPASAINPGGGVKTGTTALESELCRRTTLYPVLSDAKFSSFYYDHKELTKEPEKALNTDTVIYIPGVVFCRGESPDYKRLAEDDFLDVDVISCAPPDLKIKTIEKAEYDEEGHGVIRKCSYSITDNALLQLHLGRARQILAAAAHHDVDCLVLCAFGCSYGSKPGVVAEAYRLALVDYARYFSSIIFAVPVNVHLKSLKSIKPDEKEVSSTPFNEIDIDYINEVYHGADRSSLNGKSDEELCKIANGSDKDKASDARNFLIAKKKDLIDSVIRALLPQGSSMFDPDFLYQGGRIGVNSAITNYDADKALQRASETGRSPATFATYAEEYIKAEVRRNMIDQSMLIEVPEDIILKGNKIRKLQAEHPALDASSDAFRRMAIKEGLVRDKEELKFLLDVMVINDMKSLYHSNEDEGDSGEEKSTLKSLEMVDDSFHNLEKKDMKASIDAVLAKLSAQEQEIARMSFGLNQSEKAYRDEEIAAELGISKKKVREAIVKATGMLKAEKSLKTFL